MVSEFNKKKFYLLSFLISIGIYTFDIYNRLPLSLNDEAIYLIGKVNDYPGFGPLYSHYYNILKLLTSNNISAFYFQNIFISIIALPLSNYIFFKRINLSIERSFFLITCSTIAYWNLPNENKVQIFNYVYLVLIYLYFYNENKLKKSFFYLLITLSLFIRQDNIIILLCFIFFDRLKYSYIPLISFPILSYFLTNPFSKIRSLDTFIDHLHFQNIITKTYQIPITVHYKDYFLSLTNHPKSFIELICNSPSIFLQHIYFNLTNTLTGIMNLFSLGIQNNFQHSTYTAAILTVIFLLILFSNGQSEIKIERSSKLFLSAITLKCIITCSILAWWTKYSFELFYVLLIFLFILADRYLKKINLRKFLYLTIFFPLIFWGYNFKPYRNNSDINLKFAILKMEKIVNNNPNIKIFAPNNIKAYLLQDFKIFDPLIKPKDLSYIQNNQYDLEEFDLIVLPDKYQKDLSNNGLNIAQSVLSLDPHYFDITHELNSNLIIATKKTLSVLE